MSSEDENISERLPATEAEVEALKPAIAGLLHSIPLTWAEFDADKLSVLQSNALFLLTAAGMVEQRGWIRTTFANHPTCFEWRFQATGEGGYQEAFKRATAIEYQTWGDTWRSWCAGVNKDLSPFHVQVIRPQEWRLREQGELARHELSATNPQGDPTTVFDFVLKRQGYGPGYWNRRILGAGQPLSAEDKRIIEKELTAGCNLAQVSRPPVVGTGQLLEIRKIEQTAASQAVNLTNWPEGASAFADALGKSLGPMFEAMNKAGQVADAKTENSDRKPSNSPAATTDGQQAEAPTQFHSGEMVFLPDRVTFCGVDICSGARSSTRRVVLELLGKTRPDGSFLPYSGGDLEAKAKEKGANGTASQWVRDLRGHMMEALRNQANIVSGHRDVILSGGPGYRFAECVSVQFAPPSAITDITDTGDTSDVRNGDVRNVRDDLNTTRCVWILDQLASGRQLRAPDVAKEFKCHIKTAQRDLRVLKDAGKIEFVGVPRTGYYRLRIPPTVGQVVMPKGA